MARDTRISELIWSDMESDGLSANARLTLICIYSSHFRSLVGIIKLSYENLKIYTGLPLQSVKKAVIELENYGYIERGGCGEIWLPGFLESNPLQGGKTYKMYKESLQRVKDAELIKKMIAEQKQLPITVTAAIIDTHPELKITHKFTDEQLEDARRANAPKKYNKNKEEDQNQQEENENYESQFLF